jgi:hypothetical protein
LLPLAACLLPPHRCFFAVKASVATGQQGTGPLDGRHRAHLQVLDGRTQLLAPLNEFPLPLVHLGFPQISRPFPLVGRPFPVVGPGFTFVSCVLSFVGQPFPVVGPELALIGRTFPGRRSLPLSGHGYSPPSRTTRPAATASRLTGAGANAAAAAGAGGMPSSSNHHVAASG